MTDDAAIRAHNLREAWGEIAALLGNARAAVEGAQERLDDVDRAGRDQLQPLLQPLVDELRRITDLLQPLVDELRRATAEAIEQSKCSPS